MIFPGRACFFLFGPYGQKPHSGMLSFVCIPLPSAGLTSAFIDEIISTSCSLVEVQMQTFSYFYGLL